MRRREDAYLGFSIAALVLSCTVADTTDKGSDKGQDKGSDQARPVSSPCPSVPRQQMLYIVQLEAVVQGKGARAQRRLTTRSRLRAALALQLILSALLPTTTATAATTAAATMKNAATTPTDGTKAVDIVAHSSNSSSNSNSANPTTTPPVSTDLSALRVELARVVPFLHCFAELQVTPLSTTHRIYPLTS